MKPTQIIELFSSGKEKEAYEAIVSCAPFIEIKDSEFHFEIYKILLCFDLLSLAEKELELSIRDDKRNLKAILAMAEMYIEDSRLDKAEKLFLNSIERMPGEAELYVRYGSFLEMQEKTQAAIALYKKAFENTGESIFNSLIKDRENSYIGSSDVEEKDILEPEDRHILKFLQLFRGREGIYARQWKNARGEQGYSPISEPFTIGVAKNHILGNLTVGVYQLRIDNSVCFIVFDIDVEKSKLLDYFQKPTERRKIDSLLLSTAQEIYNICTSLDIFSYIEDSGYKGRHVWVFLRQGIQAHKAKKFGNYIISKLGKLSKEINIELFPKQTFVKSGGLGNLVKLPLGIHIKSGRRSIFLNPDGTEPENQLMFLMDIKLNEREKLKNFVDSIEISNLDASVNKNFEIEMKNEIDKIVTDEDIKALTPLQGKYTEPEEFKLDENLEYLILKSSCPVLGILCDKALSGIGLNSLEIQVITFTLGNLEFGNFIVNELLTKAGVSDTRLYLKKPLRSNPMSCNKIKNLIPNITSNYCVECFSLKKIFTYPNPLIHLHKKDNFSKLDTLILRLIDLSKKKEEIDVIYQSTLSLVTNELRKIDVKERQIGSYKIFFDDENMLRLLDSNEK
ncbi:DNA primase small subunit [Thermodesulfobium narugense DSM 14796]|uniref:DNA primase small subunit n=1 Tax=Thermodesulfobium narugense DSM 14796 TaxID=747365 RepID=M1E951_9BACT|nr:CRISPR-associated primase-polymerase type A1 [Thermodesulfobium narugense]AEE15335.1 DNA primase small subunit [Thermodesulfobium narugense DSM 14796]